jgi:ion channel-forming bestrophin family protein
MIVRPTPKLWELPFLWRLSILRRIAPQVVLVGAVGIAAVMALHRWPAAFRTFSVAPFTLLGIAVSIFLGFRNSACYDRWWEARRQLGALIGEMRSFARWAMSLPGNRNGRVVMVRNAIAYTWSLMAHLRGDAMPEEVARYANAVPVSRDIPSALLTRMEEHASAMMQAGEFGEIALARFDDRLSAFAAYQVACERIRGTPTPFTYTLLLHRTAYAFCLLLPFGLAGTLGWGTPAFAALVAYAFFGLDALGDELQEPFSTEMNALPLYAMARTVEISLLEAIGETELPDPAKPVRGILH